MISDNEGRKGEATLFDLGSTTITATLEGISSSAFLLRVSNRRPQAIVRDSSEVVQVGRQVELDGSRSIDPDGVLSAFAWTIVEQPVGSTATIVNSTAVNPTFMPDVEGFYVIELVVNDGFEDSLPAVVVVAAFPSLQCIELLTNNREGCGSDPCIAVRFSDAGVCRQRECAEPVANKLRMGQIDALALNLGPASGPPGCIGFEPEFGGTEEGARCLEALLGPPFLLQNQDAPHCSADSLSYTIIVP